MHPQAESPQSQNASPMSNFTSDFFNTLQTTFTDNSQNNSKLDMSHDVGNKSQLMMEIREECLGKIFGIVGRLGRFVAFWEIWKFGETAKRKANRTPLNMHKQAYKLGLLFNLKNSAKCQWAFYRLTKFTQQHNMRQLTGTSPNPQSQSPQITPPPQPLQSPPIQSPHKIPQPQIPQLPNNATPIRIGTLDNSISLIKDASMLCQVLERIFVHDRRQLEYGLVRIRQYQGQVLRKSYLFQILGCVGNRVLRMALLQLMNMQPVSNKQRITNEAQIRNDQLASQKLPNQMKDSETNVQSYGLDRNIKFIKIAKIGTRQPGQAPSHSASKKSIRPTGLKFNKCFKKKYQNPYKKQQPQQRPQSSSHSHSNSQSNSQSQIPPPPPLPIPPQIIPSILTQPKPIPKPPKISTQIDQPPITRHTIWKQFSSFKKTYHLAPQDLKQQVADIQDQMVVFEDNMSQSRYSGYGKERSMVFAGIHRLDSKKPLQFSNKRQKSKFATSQKSKSKRSQNKSEQQQPQTFNVQSIKSYYFPQDQKYGKAGIMPPQRQTSTKFIGSSKWSGQSKKRVSTEVLIRNVKSNQKINPYLEELREKVGKKQSEKVISLNKMVQGSISARSNSKNSRASRQEKKMDNVQITRNIQNGTKAGKPRNMSPQPKVVHEASKTPQPAVPKQWNFYQSNVSNVASPVRNLRQSSVKNTVNFQKIMKNHKK